MLEEYIEEEFCQCDEMYHTPPNSHHKGKGNGFAKYAPYVHAGVKLGHVVGKRLFGEKHKAHGKRQKTHHVHREKIYNDNMVSGHQNRQSELVLRKKMPQTEKNYRAIPKVIKYFREGGVLTNASGKRSFGQFCSTARADIYALWTACYSAAGTYDSRPIFIYDFDTHLKLTNLANGVSKVTLITMKCIKDTYKDPVSIINDTLTAVNGAVANDYLLINEGLRDVRGLGSFYKKVGEKSILLGPGETWDHKLSIQFRRTFTRNDQFFVNAGDYYLKGYTHITVAIIEGGCVSKGAGPLFSTCSGEVGYVMCSRVVVKAAPISSVALPTMLVAGTLSTGMSGETIVTQDTDLPTAWTTV